jgi:hypothetical protein
LEFLGDAILGLIVSEQLYQDFSSLAEGGLTRLRAVLVRRDTLARISRAIELGDYLFIGKGEEVSGGRLKPANLAGALEAFIGAVFIDQGLPAAQKLVLKLFRDELQIATQGAEVDYKSKLQELVQAKKQMAIAGEYPDIVIACHGGGSNFGGIAFPFLRDKIHGKSVTVLGCEPASCPTMTKGPYVYDFGDTAETTPLLPMHSLGHNFVPAPIHAGGLRYHGMAPLVSAAVV